MRPFWLLAVAGLLAAGCSSGTPAQKVITPSVSSTGGNQQKAEAEAQRLLGEVSLPSGSVMTSESIAPSLSGPAMGRPGVRSLVDRDAFWRVPLSVRATLAWINTHVPAGLTPSGSMVGAGYGFSAPSGPAWQSAELEVGAASISPTVTAVRADGVVAWLDTTPVRDTASGPRMRLTVSHGCPASDAGYVGVSNPGVAGLGSELLPAARPESGLVCSYSGLNGRQFALISQRRLDASAAADLANTVRAMPIAHPDGIISSCPMATATTIVVALHYTDRTDVDLWSASSGCASVSNGSIVVTGGLPMWLGLGAHP